MKLNYLHLYGFSFVVMATIVFMVGLDFLLNPRNTIDTVVALFVLVSAGTVFLGGIILLSIAAKLRKIKEELSCMKT